MMRIEAVRRVFPRCCLDEKKTEAGRDALGYYLERKDENRTVTRSRKRLVVSLRRLVGVSCDFVRGAAGEQCERVEQTQIA